MAVGDHYRAKALELLAHADTERDPQPRAELENLAAAYLRLADQSRPSFTNRSHFLAVAAKAMRQILVNHANAHLAQPAMDELLRWVHGG